VNNKPKYLNIYTRYLSKILVFSTLFLIFVGALVKSHEVGLSVPDWPTTYGYQMFSFPFSDMVGGIFYEHGHRMIATIVGFMTLILSVIVYFSNSRIWIKKITFLALGLVILQGIFGGLTVLLFLPAYISIIHAILAQTFLMFTILIAYSLSKESMNQLVKEKINYIFLTRPAAYVIITIYLQLIFGAIMRHTESGLAIPDFPLSAGYLFPPFNQEMINIIQSMHFDAGLPYVDLYQIVINYCHRIGALLVALSIIYFVWRSINLNIISKRMRQLTALLITLFIIQISLGAITIWTLKNPLITSMHVLNGAMLLGVGTLIILHVLPLKQIS